MAARKNPRHSLEVRARIRTTQLVKRLEMFALSEKDPQSRRAVKMTPAQVRAAIALIGKTLPDLQVTSEADTLPVASHEDALDQLA